MTHTNRTTYKPSRRYKSKQEKQRADAEQATQTYRNDQKKLEERAERLRCERELRASQLFLDQHPHTLEPIRKV